MRRATLLLVALLAACAPPLEGDSCERAAGFLHGCGVSLPLLADGPCVGARLEVADCVLENADDCRQAAELPAHIDDCISDLGDQDPDLPELPPSGQTPPARQPEADPDSCADGDDNDADGFIDCDDVSCDQACADTPAGETGDAACSDGDDNDSDTYVDCGDFDCSRDLSVTVCPHEMDDTACADGDDNDADGFIDCEDFDCQVPEVTVCA
jgi:hypothetical protein